MKSLERPPFPKRPVMARDELNLAEFPVAALAINPGDNQKTLEFIDRVFDPDAQQWREQKLSVLGSDKYGLPNPTDNDVLLALLEIAKATTDFKDAIVRFTPYELLQLLGWSDSGQSYQRLKRSLKLWASITLNFEHCWWNGKNRSWSDETFHVIEHVVFRRRDDEEERAYAVWGKPFFESLTAGNVKALDWTFYRGLQHPVAKRTYRFLDKRFYASPRLEFDLDHFAVNKIGLSKGYHTGEIKRRLQPGIQELEDKHYIQKAAPAERYIRVRRGVWRIRFAKAKKKLQPTSLPQTAPETLPPLVQQLVDRGVSTARSLDLVAGSKPGLLEEKIEVFDWLVERQDKKVSKNPGGYLAESILKNYSTPKGFEPKTKRDERQKWNQTQAEARQKAEAERERKETEKRDAERAPVLAYLASLTTEERAALEHEALASHAWGQKAVGDSEMAVAFRQMIVESFAKKRFQEQSSS